MPVQVNLSAVTDLTEAAQLQMVDTSIQELTGDWISSQLRDPQPNITPPNYTNVPTQQLAHALNGTGLFEGLLSFSARVPTKRNLIVFPELLKAGSTIRYTDAQGTAHGIPPIKARRKR